MESKIKQVLDAKDAALEKAEGRIAKLEEILDGCLPVVESWVVISPAQMDWKKEWLRKSKALLGET